MQDAGGESLGTEKREKPQMNTDKDRRRRSEVRDRKSEQEDGEGREDGIQDAGYRMHRKKRG